VQGRSEADGDGAGATEAEAPPTDMSSASVDLQAPDKTADRR